MKNHPLVAIYLSLAFLARESASFRISPSTSTRRVGARGTIHAAPASMGMGTCTVNGLSSASRTDANSAWTTTTTMMMTMAANRPKRSANHPRKSFEFQLTTTAKTTATTTLHNNYNYNNNNNNNNSLLLLLLPTLPPSLPKYLPLSLLHILGGTTGTSTVLRATKSWYKRISLPPWTPPNFVFGPVWTTLYGLMGYSVHRILHPATAATIATRNIALRAWSLHYLLNLSWAPLFFGFQCLRAGLVVNILLLTSLSLVILPLFRSIDPVAAYVQLPYLAWLAYATVLNNEICRLNPMVGGVNEAMVQADLCDGDDEGYNEAMLEYDLKKLQKAAERYADGW